MSETCESATGPSIVSLSKIAATGFSTTASSMLSSPRARSTSSISLWRRPANDDSSRVTWRHREAPAADELEERRRELVAARDDALGEQRRHERRRQVVGRLVHVLRRRAGRVLAAEAPVARTPPSSPAGTIARAAAARIHAHGWWSVSSSSRLSRSARSAGGLLAGDGRRQHVVVHAPRVRRVRREHRGRIEHAQDHGAPGRHVVDSAEHVAAAHGDAMLEPGRLDPRARAGRRAGGVDVREQGGQPALPLIAPDLGRHLDRVVVGDDDAPQAVAQRVRALAAVLLVVPDDAQALGQPHRAEACRARRCCRAPCSRPARRRCRPRSPARPAPSRPSPAGCRGRRR